MPNNARFFTTFYRHIKLPSTFHPSSQHKILSLQWRNEIPVRTKGLFQHTHRRASSSHPTEHQNYYTFFPKTLGSGYPPYGPFRIDVAQLRAEYKKSRDLLQPDQIEAKQALSQAYKTLKDPLRRAQYVFSLKGIDATGDEGIKVPNRRTRDKVLKMKEMIANAEKKTDLMEMKEINEKRLKKCVKGMNECFRKGNLERAREKMVNLRYWTDIKQSIYRWEHGETDELDIEQVEKDD